MRARVLAALGLAGAAVAAAGGPGEPPFERPAVMATAGPHSLPVDLPLLAGSATFTVERHPAAPGTTARSIARGGLRDLRLFDARGGELPFLLVDPPLPEPEWHDATALWPLPLKKTQSGFEADLGAATTVDRLRLRGLPAPFLKKLSLDGSGDRLHWVRLSPGATLFDLPDSDLELLEVGFRPSVFRYLRVSWDDRSSARVPLPREVAARGARADAPARPPATVAVGVERHQGGPHTSRFRLHLPAAALPIVALRVEADGEHLLRLARVTEARLVGDCAVPAVLGEATLRRTVRGDLAAEDLRIPVSTPATAELELAVDDGDNPPLALRSVEAELAELPWIYLELAEPQTILARWGDPRKAAPRYDLESARERVAAAPPPPTGTWGAVAAAAAGPLPPSAPPGTGPQVDATGFRYSRLVRDAEAVLTAVPLDAAVLAHSAGGLAGDFRDLRLVDASGRQIPYLLERRAEPLVLALPRLVADAASPFGPGATAYRVPLPFAALPPARLVLRTRGRVFSRQVDLRVVEPDVRARRQHPQWSTLASAQWRHADPGAAAPVLTLGIPTVASPELVLVVHEGDNLPLPLEPPELLLLCYQLRFFRPGPGRLRLLYGNPQLAPPRYDLALLAPALLTRAAVETALEAEQALPSAEHRVLAPKAFWAVILAAAAALLLVIAHLVRRATPGR